MGKSINGWPAPCTSLKTFKIAGTKRAVTLDKDAGRILAALAADYHALVKPIDEGPWDEGGYNYRQARSANALSNHASGTAVDLNWSKEGSRSLANKAFFALTRPARGIRQIKKRYGSCVQWGGDWSDRYFDPMHWEIKPGVTKAQVRELARALNIDANGVRKAT